MMPAIVSRKQAEAQPMHMRLWSASTATSVSPHGADDRPCPPKQMSNFRDPTRQSKISSKAKTAAKVQRKRRLNFGVEDPNKETNSGAGPTSRRKPAAIRKAEQQSLRSSLVATRTPAAPRACLPMERRAMELLTSPGGTDYIMTPGRHKIEMNEFLATIDMQVVQGACPRMRGIANYAEGMHQLRLEAEKRIPPGVFMLSFPEKAPMESFRQMAVQTVFNYAVAHDLHENTIHLACLNISRIVYAKIASGENKVLTHEMFACTVLAALRAAIKSDEYFEKVDKIRLDPSHLWRTSDFIKATPFDKPAAYSQKLNAVESDCLALLQDPANPPLAPEFLERYLAVGGWPEHCEKYQELGSFLLGVALFAGGEDNPLRGIPCSKLAAAALVLAVKIINTDAAAGNKYEFWPARLERYTGYHIEDLKPGIRGLAGLLRNKPPQSKILEKYYTRWGEYDWN
eukprot:Blabericola_migrator_1__1876@NODE_150_length_12827_cov_208_685893_g131_i0_p2_GENE_NODE_150_length_12827_cov_208_685893_g131_i0NODE_150_length_12827_cov_208_685893_g131_i0_p2_ORF_typecomplete_len457_score65_92Cyclin_C/PF02984_19/9_6e10Cyclin_N/PF00134_23/0_13Cyclin_N/PF00134_23/1_2e02_NODE_150_length_12827_cov_208_685893_g131_i071968566